MRLRVTLEKRTRMSEYEDGLIDYIDFDINQVTRKKEVEEKQVLKKKKKKTPVGYLTLQVRFPKEHICRAH